FAAEIPAHIDNCWETYASTAGWTGCTIAGGVDEHGKIVWTICRGKGTNRSGQDLIAFLLKKLNLNEDHLSLILTEFFHSVFNPRPSPPEEADGPESEDEPESLDNTPPKAQGEGVHTVHQADPSPVDLTVDQAPLTTQSPAEDEAVDLPTDAPHATQLPAEDEAVDLPTDAPHATQLPAEDEPMDLPADADHDHTVLGGPVTATHDASPVAPTADEVLGTVTSEVAHQVIEMLLQQGHLTADDMPAAVNGLTGGPEAQLTNGADAALGAGAASVPSGGQSKDRAQRSRATSGPAAKAAARRALAHSGKGKQSKKRAPSSTPQPRQAVKKARVQQTVAPSTDPHTPIENVDDAPPLGRRVRKLASKVVDNPE
ncbi:hypothetical protein EIP86_005302, partial [Pleurotus ostreatoroseus]